MPALTAILRIGLRNLLSGDVGARDRGSGVSPLHVSLHCVSPLGDVQQQNKPSEGREDTADKNSKGRSSVVVRRPCIGVACSGQDP